MAEAKAERYAERTLDLKLMTDRQLQDVWTELGTHNVPSGDFFQACVRRGYLTNYQVELLTANKREGYFHGDYKILYMVGMGTFARVYRAAHRETNEIMAVKVLRRRHLDKKYAGQPAVDQFTREGELGLKLRHPNVVAVHQVSSKDRVCFLVMDFVEGYNLKDFLKMRRRIDPVEATRIMADVARGLNYAHEQGLAHRDMKITNVLISSRGQAKLADFGTASLNEDWSAEMIADMDLPNTRTIEYAALERATGVRGDHTRSDLFFLGCIFYQILTGKSPLQEPHDKMHRLSRTRFEDIEPLQQAYPSLPQPVALIVNRAMMLDPERRYQTPDRILADLEALQARMSGKPAEGEQPGATPTVAKAFVPDQPLRSLILVEGDVKRQEQLRAALGKVGYAVTATTDPFMAIGKFFENPQVAEGLLINAQDVGMPALNAFNRLADNAKTQAVPVVLLLDEPQRAWEDNAKKSDHRIVLHMPLKIGTLREALDRIVVPAPRT
ncbi:MAG: serine/threonine protein kinase [Thermoguttaceae bacterium]